MDKEIERLQKENKELRSEINKITTTLIIIAVLNVVLVCMVVYANHYL